DARRAIELLEQSIAAGGTEFAMLAPDARGMLCFTLTQVGDTDRAIAVGEDYLVVAQANAAGSNLADALWLLGLAYLRVDPMRAHDLVEESLASDARFRSFNRAWALVAAGQARIAVNEHLGAIDAFVQAINLSQVTGDRQVVPVSLEGMARALRRLDRPFP